jgi:hypothetical protein
VVAGVKGEVTALAGVAVKELSAQSRSAAMSDGPEGAALLRRKCRAGFKKLRQETAQHLHDGEASGHGSTWQFAAEIVHETQGILSGLMRDVEIDHGGVDLLMAEEFLNRVQMSAGFEEMRGKGMAQGMDGSSRDVELIAGQDHEPLQGGTGHGPGGVVHANSQSRGVVVPTTHVGKDQEWMPVKRPVGTQFLIKRRGQRHDAIAMPFAASDEELVFSAGDVVDGERQAFAQAQAASVDELDGSAVTAQADEVDEIDDLLSSEHGGKAVVILRADLGEDGPLGTLQQLDKEHARGGCGLADGFGTPPFFELHEKEVVAQLGFSDQSRIAFKMFVNEPELAIIGVAGAIGVVMQS